jgi:predicted esterase
MKSRSLYIILFYLLLPVLTNAQVENIRIERCEADTTESYALYVPEKVNALLIFLDPAARGELPLRKYFSLADEYGILMAGSLNSRNFDAASSVRSFVAMYNDIVKKYSIDATKIWLSGFSGGARAATNIALNFPEVKAVIGCGAGFASDNFDAAKLCSYAAIVGDRDMNFSELSDNTSYLDKQNVKNLLLKFEGGHEWPPVQQFGLAIEWLCGLTDTIVLQATERGAIAFKNIEAEAGTGLLYSSGLEANQMSRIKNYRNRAIKMYDSLTAIHNFHLDSISYYRASAEEESLLNRFSFLFTIIVDGNAPIDSVGPKDMANQIHQMINSGGYRGLAGERCFDNCKRVCQEYFFKLSGEQNYAAAFNTAMLLSFFIPQKPDAYWMMAKVKALMTDKVSCEKMLKIAISKGLKLDQQIINTLSAVLKKEEVEKMFLK